MLVVGLKWKHGYVMPWNKIFPALFTMVALSAVMALGIKMMLIFGSEKVWFTLVYTAIGGAFYLGAWFLMKKYCGWNFRKI